MASSKPTRRLSCKQAARRTTDFLEGRLSATMRAQFVRHLATCASCYAYARQIALVRERLRKLPRIEMRESARRKLLKRLAERASQGLQTRWSNAAGGDSMTPWRDRGELR